VRALTTAALIAAATAAACVPDGLAFRVDERVSISSPEDREEVSLPLTIDWEVEDFDGTFAVFVDRAPIGPGDDLPEDLPTGVFATGDTELVLESLPATSADEDVHTVTIVLIDSDGRRLGESAFDVRFETEEQ
jgi:hypothetical protein